MEDSGTDRVSQIMAAPFDNMNGYAGFILPHFRSVSYVPSFEMNATKFQVNKLSAVYS